MIKKAHLKIFLTVIITLTIFISNIMYVSALDQGRISSTTGTKLRKGAGTTFDSQLTVPHNAIVTINTQNVQTSDSSTGCTTGLWHNVTYQEYTGYVCSRYVEILSNTDNEEVEPPTSDMATMTDEEFNAYLNEQGFPESYKVKLKELHKYYGKSELTKENLDSVKEIFITTGALEYSNNMMNKLFVESKEKLETIDFIEEDKKSVLRGFITYLNLRNK